MVGRLRILARYYEANDAPRGKWLRNPKSPLPLTQPSTTKASTNYLFTHITTTVISMQAIDNTFQQPFKRATRAFEGVDARTNRAFRAYQHRGLVGSMRATVTQKSLSSGTNTPRRHIPQSSSQIRRHIPQISSQIQRSIRGPFQHLESSRSNTLTSSV